MENETASKRDQFIALQSEMKSEEDEAMFKLGEILNSPATRKMIKDMQDLKDRCGLSRNRSI